MDVKGVNEFIPRDLDPGIAEILNFFSDVTCKFVDFGSNFFIWEEHATKTEENIAPSMLLRHFLDLADSISVLLRTSCADPAKLLLRGLLETHFSLEYLLDKDTDRRAMAFLVEDILAEISVMEKMIQMRDSQPQAGASRRFRVRGKDLTLDEVLQERTALLQSEKYIEVFNEFNKLKGKSKYYPHWYSCFNGPKTIRGIAEQAGKGDLYDNIYSVYSRSTHGTDVVGGKLTSSPQNYADIIQIRRPTDAQQVARFTLYLCTTTIQNYMGKRMPGQISRFREWFPVIKDKVNLIMSEKQFIRAE